MKYAMNPLSWKTPVQKNHDLHVPTSSNCGRGRAGIPCRTLASPLEVLAMGSCPSRTVLALLTYRLPTAVLSLSAALPLIKVDVLGKLWNTLDSKSELSRDSPL